MIAIVLGSILISSGIEFFLMPIKVLDGGFIGLALITNYLFDIKVGLVLLLCSLPVFVYAWFKDKPMFFHSLLGLIVLTYFIDLFDPYYPFGPFVHHYPFISSVAGGLCIGIGFGILLRNEASTGGIDLLAKLLTDKLNVNVGLLILLMDACVVLLGGLLFSVDTFFLSIATIGAGGLATSLCTLKLK